MQPKPETKTTPSDDCGRVRKPTARHGKCQGCGDSRQLQALPMLRGGYEFLCRTCYDQLEERIYG